MSNNNKSLNMGSTVFFIGSHRQEKGINNVIDLFVVSPYDIVMRVFESFIPPCTKYKKVHVDLLGPLLGFLLLSLFVTYGNSFKLVQLSVTPVEFLAIYSILMPLFAFILCKLGQSTLTFYETLSLLGYTFYGHLFTLLTSFMLFQEDSNFFFFVCLIFFGGLSSIRLILVLSGTISAPAARLLICSSISVLNILCLIFLHFAYMHKTYGHKDN